MTPFDDDPSLHPDESFGPGTDLAICLVAVLLLLSALVLVSRPEEHAHPEPQQPKQVWIIQERYGDEPLFEKDRATLTATAKAQLKRQLQAMTDALAGEECNQLLIEGYASPEVPADRRRHEQERWNLKLSGDRAMAVADYLYWQGVPYECMSVSAFGRSHSKALAGWLRPPGGRRSLFEWDAAMPEAAGEVGEPKLAPERLVRIFGTHHPYSLCELAF